MNAYRFFLIILVFIAVSSGWMILGTTLKYRTAKLEDKLGAEVDTLWGPSGLAQSTPLVGGGEAGTTDAAQPLASDINVHFEHGNRHKGLLWFSTYTVRFTGIYTYSPQTSGTFIFHLPADVPRFGNLKVSLDDEPIEVDGPVISGNIISLALPPDDKEHTVMVSYLVNGRDRWTYDVTDEGYSALVLVKNFSLTMTTNFADIDYTDGSASPTSKAEKFENGVKAVWNYESERTRQAISIDMPSRKNAGPLAARMSYFAPVSLLFFFTVFFTIVVLQKVPLHPMHYLFVAAGFFAFHILLAYLVDHMGMHAAFWICAAVSVFLVVTYMRLVASVRFAVIYVGLAQLVYLVGFSYAFFLKGWTGLTITIGAIVTLFVLMQLTGRLNWEDIFKRAIPLAAIPVPPPSRAAAEKPDTPSPGDGDKSGQADSAD
ncbi:MAG: inner membrane CreD family protein [Planctomycetia bacterium]|nr:inner membrane CreD family protein [Planctomycetia bacterium]